MFTASMEANQTNSTILLEGPVVPNPPFVATWTMVSPNAQTKGQMLLFFAWDLVCSKQIRTSPNQGKPNQVHTKRVNMHLVMEFVCF